MRAAMKELKDGKIPFIIRRCVGVRTGARLTFRGQNLSLASGSACQGHWEGKFYASRHCHSPSPHSASAVTPHSPAIRSSFCLQLLLCRYLPDGSFEDWPINDLIME